MPTYSMVRDECPPTLPYHVVDFFFVPAPPISACCRCVSSRLPFLLTGFPRDFPWGAHGVPGLPRAPVGSGLSPHGVPREPPLHTNPRQPLGLPIVELPLIPRRRTGRLMGPHVVPGVTFLKKKKENWPLGTITSAAPNRPNKASSPGC